MVGQEASASPSALRTSYMKTEINTSTVPQALDAIADLVLAYRPKPKSNPAKKRKRRVAKIAREREG
jgi:hypothetical protein